MMINCAAVLPCLVGCTQAKNTMFAQYITCLISSRYITLYTSSGVHIASKMEREHRLLPLLVNVRRGCCVNSKPFSVLSLSLR
uniref:Putative secreted peptide n=1 Tax=Anopheles braziliensis TaxID=58242 RepID=A0A2M3ZN04_9DIPT